MTFPTPDMSLTRLLVVTDLERSKAWYRDVLGASVEGEYGGTSCVLRFLDAWLLLVTGGPGVVKEAMNSGKKVIAGGPGNPPAVVDETANLEIAARGIVAGASIDNNIICTAEKETFCVESVVDRLLAPSPIMMPNSAITRTS